MSDKFAMLDLQIGVGLTMAADEGIHGRNLATLGWPAKVRHSILEVVSPLLWRWVGFDGLFGPHGNGYLRQKPAGITFQRHRSYSPSRFKDSAQIKVISSGIKGWKGLKALCSPPYSGNRFNLGIKPDLRTSATLSTNCPFCSHSVVRPHIKRPD